MCTLAAKILATSIPVWGCWSHIEGQLNLGPIDLSQTGWKTSIWGHIARNGRVGARGGRLFHRSVAMHIECRVSLLGSLWNFTCEIWRWRPADWGGAHPPRFFICIFWCSLALFKELQTSQAESSKIWACWYVDIPPIKLLAYRLFPIPQPTLRPRSLGLCRKVNNLREKSVRGQLKISAFVICYFINHKLRKPL